MNPKESENYINNHTLDLTDYFPNFGFYLSHPSKSIYNTPFMYNIEVDEETMNKINETQSSHFPFTNIYINPFSPDSKSVKQVSYIQPDITSFWMYDKLLPIFNAANTSMFNFDIDCIPDPLQYSIETESKESYPFHQDIGSFSQNNRKLTMIVQLSDPQEYEGGEHQIMINGHDDYFNIPKEKGLVLVFPTFLMHRTKPIIKGSKKTLTLWAGGRAFR